MSTLHPKSNAIASASLYSHKGKRYQHNRHGGRTDWARGDGRKTTARHEFVELQTASKPFYPRG